MIVCVIEEKSKADTNCVFPIENAAPSNIGAAYASKVGLYVIYNSRSFLSHFKTLGVTVLGFFWLIIRGHCRQVVNCVIVVVVVIVDVR